MSKKLKKKVKCDISYYTKVCEIIPIVKIHGYSFFKFQYNIKLQDFYSDAFCWENSPLTKAKPAENFNNYLDF